MLDKLLIDNGQLPLAGFGLTLKTISTKATSSIHFKKSYPIKWEEFQEHLKSLEITQFGQGEGLTPEGTKVPLLAAMHKDGQVIYIPQTKEVMVIGEHLEPSLNLYKEVLSMIAEIFGSTERLKGNTNFYEIQFQAQVEPDGASPLEIMNLITPPGLFQPFEDVLGVQVGMFQYRFYYTPSKVEETIKQTVPWYDAQFFPEIENPDRFIIQLVCRDISGEVTIKRTKSLYERAIDFLTEKEKELNRKRS